MLFEKTNFCEWLPTLWPSKWLLTCVGPFMLLQMTTFCWSLLTLWTSKLLPPVWILSWFFKWLLTVNDLSHLEQAKGSSPVFHVMDTFTQSLVTLCSSKLLFSRVDPFMLFQASICDECSVAFGTNKGLFTCVYHFIFLQMNTVCEWLVTFGTSKGLFSCVGLFMCFQRVLWPKALPHSEQVNCFYPIWILWCLFKLPLCVNQSCNTLRIPYIKLQGH